MSTAFSAPVSQAKRNATPQTTEIKAESPKYQQPHSPDQQTIHLANKQRLSSAIADLREAFFQANPNSQGPAFREHLHQQLSEVLRHAAIDASPYAARCAEREQPDHLHGYGKFLLYREDNAGAPFCLQYFHFEPGQKTPLHDHPVACISVVARGVLRERLYDAAGDGLVRKSGSRDRGMDNKAAILDLAVSNIHSLKNKSLEPAASVHLYFMDGELQHRAVKTLYKEARTVNQAN